MTRKDYLLIAEAFANARVTVNVSKTLVTAEQGIGIVASYLAEALARDNDFFDTGRFLAACGETS